MQSLMLTFPVNELKYPAGHWVSFELPEGQYDPIKHGDPSFADLPSVLHTVPAEHAMQAFMLAPPLFELKVPAGQAIQASMLIWSVFGLYFPLGQGVWDALPATQ